MNADRRDSIRDSLRQLAEAHAATMQVMERTCALLCEELALDPAECRGPPATPDPPTGLRQPVIDRSRFAVTFGGRTCRLGNTIAFRFVARLAESPDRYVPHEQLLDDVWDGHGSDDARPCRYRLETSVGRWTALTVDGSPAIKVRRLPSPSTIETREELTGSAVPTSATSRLLSGVRTTLLGRSSSKLTTGKLPEADYAFIDELWKASSAILNTLLKILNERVYDAGDGAARRVPLRLCVAASNEWPSPDTGKELSALLDRFVLRKSVAPIRSAAGRQKLLWTRDHTPRFSGTVTPAEVEQARRQALALPWSADARDALEAVLKELAKEGVQPGDRRQFKTVGVVQAFAYLYGADEVQPEHLEVAQHCLWDDPAEQPQKAAQVIAKIANPVGMRVTQLLLEAEQVLAAADVRNLADAAKAAAKLAEIDRQMATLKGNGRVEKARSYLKDQLKKLKLASIEAV